MTKDLVQDSAWDLREPWTRSQFVVAVLDLFGLKPEWTTREVATRLDCNKAQARSILHNLALAGKIHSLGEKRMRRWKRIC